MEKTEIKLVILSPSSEANKLTFSPISTATTVGELSERIAATIITHPPPARQRLIYRGHALVDPNRTLKDIFTQEIINSSESLSLHLVLPPDPTTRSGTSASNISNNGQRSGNSPIPQEDPRVVRGPQYQQQGIEGLDTPGHSGQNNGVPADSRPVPHVHVQGATSNAAFPPQLQQAFAHFHAVNQQIAAQLAAVGNNATFQGVGSNPAHAQTFQQPPFTPPHVQQSQPQQHQVPTTGEQAGSGASLQQPTQVPQMGTPTAQGHIQHMASPLPSGGVSTTFQEIQGPNGERWRSVTPNSQMNIYPNNNPFNPPGVQHSRFTTNIARHASPGAQSNRSPHRQTPSIALAHLQSNLSTMDAAIAGGNPLPEAVFDQARGMLRGIPDMPQEERSNINERLDGLASRANHLRMTLNDQLSRAAQERVTAQRVAHGAQSSAVYILSSPSGPHALLVGPSGIYTTPWQPSGLGSVSPYSLVYHHNSANLPPQAPLVAPRPLHLVAQPQQHATQQINGAQVGQANPEQHQQQRQQQQQQPVNQARDLFRILLPLGGHLWLLIRLFGFVYFFTAGAGWRRTILLGLVACLVFLAQTGIFRPFVQSVWGPIRRHAEGLVPLAGNERPVVQAAGAGGNANTSDSQATNREPTPQEAAERLLQERERQDVNFVRQSIRRIERAIALFLASLVPGVGERHIAAREAAEAARQAETREREERVRREEDAARQRDQENVSETTETNGDPQVASDGIHGPEGSGEAEKPPPPPLVEV